MSKAAKQSIFILIALLLASVGYLGVTLLDKSKLQQSKTSLEQEIESFRSRETQQKLENKKLQDQLVELETKKKELEDKLSRVDVSKEDLDSELKKLSDERDALTKRVGALQDERDKLLVKLQEKPAAQIVYQPVEQAAQETQEPQEEQAQKEAEAAPAESEDAFWAQVLKEKATLELELDNLKEQLSGSSVDIVELKKQNSDLQLELSKVEKEKDQIIRDIKHGNDLADSLSLELARAQNDRKYLNGRYDDMISENTSLNEQIKQLTSTKIALEKSIVRLQNEKKEIEKKLLQTENVIQGRINEIYQIKDSLEKAVTPKMSGRNEIELPPIVVSSQTSAANKAPAPDEGSAEESEEKSEVGGSVVSVNDENNFVILDVGEEDGVKLGDSLSVYRGTEFIGALEIIQLRKDIAAADIKTKVTQIQVGDVVR